MSPDYGHSASAGRDRFLSAMAIRPLGIALRLCLPAFLACWITLPAHAASYTYTTTTFAWHDPIASGDIRIANWNNPCTGYCDAIGDDSISPLLNLGFTFNFAGTNFTQLYVQTDGRVMFNNNYSYYGTTSIGVYNANPSPPPPFIWDGANPRVYTLTPLPQGVLNNAMVVYGTDVDVSPGGSGGGPSATGCSASASIPTAGNGYTQGPCGIYYAQIPNGCGAGCGQFVVTWLNVPDWGDATSSYNFQVIINQNGTFVYQFNTSVNPEFGQAEVGYQGASVADYVNVNYPAPTSPYAGGISALAGTALLWSAVPASTVGKFNAFETTTAAGAVTGLINTKVAGSTFTLALVAVNAGAQDNTFSGTVGVDLIGNASPGVALNANNCPVSSSSVLGSVNATFTAGPGSGRQNLTFAAVPNVWKDARVRFQFPAGTYVCSTDNFAVRPAALSVAAYDLNWKTAGSSARALSNVAATGGNVHQADYVSVSSPAVPFRIAVTALNASGVAGGITQYNGAPTIVSTACIVIAGMGSCNPGALYLPGSSWAAGNPVINDSAAYSEAGAFGLVVQDLTFAGVDAPDNEPAATFNVPNSASSQIGRFVPASFTVSISGAAPQFSTFNTTDLACNAGAAAPKRSFTYIGQPFGYVTVPTALITAVDASGTNTTTNYRGTLWKIAGAAAAASCSPATVCTAVTGGVTQVYTSAGGQGFDSSKVGTLTTPGSFAAPTVTSLNNGTGTVTVNTADVLAFSRTTTTPLTAPFNANISFNLTAQDANENAVTNNGIIVTTGAGATFNGSGAGIIFDGGGASAGTEMRYGRLHLQNAAGSQLISMPIPITTEYWNGTAFVTNSADDCTTISANNIAIGNPQGGLTAAAVSPPTVGGAFLAGVGSLRLPKPSTGNSGSVDVAVNLTNTTSSASCAAGLTSAAGANMAYLQSLWCTPPGNYTSDPTARATFGVRGGANQFIYQRENY